MRFVCSGGLQARRPHDGPKKIITSRGFISPTLARMAHTSLIPDDIVALSLLALALLVACLAAAARACYSSRERVRAQSLAVPLLDASDVEMGERPVQNSVRLLDDALAGEADLKVDALAHSGQKFCDVLEKLGPFKMILNDVRGNLTKIERTPYRPPGTELLRPLVDHQLTGRQTIKHECAD